MTIHACATEGCGYAAAPGKRICGDCAVVFAALDATEAAGCRCRSGPTLTRTTTRASRTSPWRGVKLIHEPRCPLSLEAVQAAAQAAQAAQRDREEKAEARR